MRMVLARTAPVPKSGRPCTPLCGRLLTRHACRNLSPSLPSSQTPEGVVTCTVPRYTVLEEGASFEEALSQIGVSGLALPVLVTPVWADGRAGSHALAVVTAEAGLRHLSERGSQLGLALPAVAQQYVPHGGCLFKVYVLGRHVRMVTRPSLDLEAERAARPGAREPLQRTTSNPCPGLRMASRVSAYPSSVPWGEADLAPKVRRVWC